MVHSKTRSRSQTSAAPRGSVLEDMMSLAGSFMRGQKEYGAYKISSLADATREFAENLPEMPSLRNYVESAADRLEELSDYVTTTEFEEMIDDAGRFARTYPLMTLGLAIAAGVGASRLLEQPLKRQLRQAQPPQQRRRPRGRAHVGVSRKARPARAPTQEAGARKHA